MLLESTQLSPFLNFLQKYTESIQKATKQLLTATRAACAFGTGGPHGPSLSDLFSFFTPPDPLTIPTTQTANRMGGGGVIARFWDQIGVRGKLALEASFAPFPLFLFFPSPLPSGRPAPFPRPSLRALFAPYCLLSQPPLACRRLLTSPLFVLDRHKPRGVNKLKDAFVTIF